MMDYHLPSHVSFAQLGERAVALDLSVDRYFLIAAPEAAALVSLGGAVEGRADRASIEALVRRRLIGIGEGAPISPVMAEPLQQSALEVCPAGGRLPISEVAWFRGMASLSLRVRGLQPTLRRACWRRRQRTASLVSPSMHAATRIAQAYADARLLLPAKQLCVPDSLALARILWRRGVDADIYFGVRLQPFMAHAWVQWGDMLLSDKLNTVGEYTPVFRL